MEKEPKQSIERLKQLADELERLELEASDGRGIVYVHWIVGDLRKGDFEIAKTNYRQQSDKYGAYPKIVKFLEGAGIATDLQAWMKEAWKKHGD